MAEKQALLHIDALLWLAATLVSEEFNLSQQHQSRRDDAVCCRSNSATMSAHAKEAG
jgi:hypothetical protein